MYNQDGVIGQSIDAIRTFGGGVYDFLGGIVSNDRSTNAREVYDFVMGQLIESDKFIVQDCASINVSNFILFNFWSFLKGSHHKLKPVAFSAIVEAFSGRTFEEFYEFALFMSTDETIDDIRPTDEIILWLRAKNIAELNFYTSLCLAIIFRESS